MRRALSIALSVTLPTALLLALSCSKNVPPAEKPLRPTPEEEEESVAPTAKTDCERNTVGDDLEALKYDDRRVIEAQNLADEGFDTLRAAEKRGVAKSERENMITRAVKSFITALKADPYNVHATYNLAAAYARIKRYQCSLNLLARLEALRRLPSQTAKVNDKLDRLFGRGRYKNDLDDDFEKLRDDPRFRKLARKLPP